MDQFLLFGLTATVFNIFFGIGCNSELDNVRGGMGEAENTKILSLGCFKPPESVPIACHLINVKSFKCISDNVFSITSTPDNDSIGEIKCTSPLPIDLSFKGYQLNDFLRPSFVRHTKNTFVNDTTFTYSVSLPLSHLNASRRVIVSLYDDPKQKLSFFLFRPGGSVFSSNYKPDPGSSLNQTLSPLILKHTGKYLLIPCIPNDPNVTVILEVPSAVAHLKQSFDKMKGFTIQTDEFIDPSGRYVCKAEGEEASQEETVIFDVQPKSGSIFEPTHEKIYLFHNSELHVSCKSTQPVVVAGLFDGVNIISRKNEKGNGSWSSVDSSTANPRYRAEYSEKLHAGLVGATGIIQCKTSWTGIVLKTWDIEVLDIYNNSALQLHKISEKEIACESNTFPTEDVKLQLIFCQGETGCKLNEFCFDEKEVNSARIKKSTCPKTMKSSTPCVIPDPVGTSPSFNNSVCLILPRKDLDGLYSQGMIRCTAGPLSYQTTFLVGFDGILYLDLTQAPISALIQILTPKEPMYSLTSYPFACKATKFLSDGTLQWVIRELNGSETAIHNEKRIQEAPGFYATPRDYQLYTVKESHIRLVYPNVSDLVCKVPRWNGAGWVSLHKRINVTARPVAILDPVSQPSNSTTIVAVSASVVVVLLAIIAIVIWRLIKAKNKIRNLTEKEVEHFLEGDSEAIAMENMEERNAHELVEALPYDKKFEIPRERLLIQKKSVLGRGASGIVYKGSVKGVFTGVAVKTVNSDCEVKRFIGFLSELKMMIYLGKHPHIVSLVGAHTEKIKQKILYIVIELCPNGCLEGYLRKNKSSFVDQIINEEIKPELTLHIENSTSSTSKEAKVMTTADFIKWSYQVANGMEYLGTKKVIHGDVAARNILIDHKGNAKIADFGLSRRLFDYAEYVKKQQEDLPWRHMAIESLQEMRFSTQSDVWAFGVLLWEILSVGEKPYPGLSWSVRFLQQLKNGVRMIKPTHCTNEIYGLMHNCWKENPEERPSFGYVAGYFKSLLGNLDREYMEMEEESQTKYEYDNACIDACNGDSQIPGYLSREELTEIVS